MEWLDSLSEDWVSQPRSNLPSSSPLGSPNRSVNGSRSKLPRPTSSGRSSAAPAGSRPPSSASTSARKAVLRAQTPSQVNSSLRRKGHDGSVKDWPSKTAETMNAYGTVQQNAKATAHVSGHATPEWKRRLVNGKHSTNESTDLLSSKPVKLEGIFKPPTLKSKELPRGVAKRPSLQQGGEISDNHISDGRQAGQLLHSGNGDQLARPYTTTDDHVQCSNEGKAQDRPPPDSREASVLSWDHTMSDNFSPAIVSKQLTANGKLDFIATPSPRKRTNEAPNHHSSECGSTGASNELGDCREQVFFPQPESSVVGDQVPDMTSQSLPADLSVGTNLEPEDVIDSMVVSTVQVPDGALQRLEEASFSFEVDADQRAGRPELVSASEEFELPQTPEPQRPTAQSSPERARSSLSPLKLFDKYDTFTNDRVFRRLSKFEETLAQTKSDTPVSNEGRSSPTSPSPLKSATKQRPSEDVRSPNSSQFSSFGEGRLDDYLFPDDVSREPSLPKFPRVPVTESINSLHSQRRHKQRPRTASQRHRLRQAEELSTTGDDLRSASNNDGPSRNGKRPSQSPSKDAARKRRRTLQGPQEGDWAAGGANAEEQQLFGTPAGNMGGRKRKDARYEKEQQVVDPEILAMRHIRRPRNPTPNQVSSSTRHSPNRIEPQAPSSPLQPNEQVHERQYDAPTRILAVALADQSIHAAEKLMSGSRRSSLNTGDYLGDAERIMNFIRAENRPRSSDEALKKSRFGEPTIYEESTMDRLSRPPSREGIDRGVIRQGASTDTRAFSQLRKFADGDDFGLAFNSTLKSLRLSRSNAPREAHVVDYALTANAAEETDLPNTSIREPIASLQQQGASSSGHSQGHSRHGSQASTESDVRSIPTRSSATSSNKMTIAPQNVAHLLSDCMAGMVFDREKKKWVRHKQASLGPKAPEENVSGMSDDDFFNDIPDLSVNEMDELRRVRHFVSANSQGHPFSTNADVPAKATETPLTNNDDGDRPQTADGKTLPPVEDSSAPSKYSRLASSGPLPSTRATSWGDEQWLPKSQAPLGPALPALEEDVDQPISDEVEREISIMEGRVAQVPIRDRKSRVLTVTFSSPPVGQMHSPDIRDALDHDRSDIYDESPSRQSSILVKTAERPRSISLSRRPKARASSRRMSLDEQRRPMSRLDEHEEMSLVHYTSGRSQTLDLAISTPLPLTRSFVGPPDSANRSVSAYRLSPLSDFTVNQLDQPVDALTEARTRATSYQRTVGNANQISLTAQSLIKHLTDLEPYEPYWEYIRTIDLGDRGITSLHMLDELCNHAERLDVTNNAIGELNGVPSTVRLLNIRNNCLSDLSSWHHLRNLQYLDLSQNQLSTFRGLWSLVHLRSLKADYNSLETLAGLEGLDGLQSLSVRGNRLRQLDFEEFDLTRLLELNVSHNGLAKIENVRNLAGLKVLNISHNKLTSWSTTSASSKLEDLDLAGNELDAFDLSAFPGLQRLDLSYNCVNVIGSAHLAKSLSHLSLRSQRPPAPISLDNLNEVEHLHLSANAIPKFAPLNPFLNLRTLELASCGLHTLSHDFGRQCPNIRSLNLNYNALRDISTLSGIIQLERLEIASNRISRLRQTSSALASLSLCLSHLDLRDNPLTLGFYHPCRADNGNHQVVTYPPGTVDRDSSVAADEKWQIQYQLPLSDVAEDAAARERLDDATKARRRVYELMVMETCARLEFLDGLAVDRQSTQKQDGVWHRLNELGVLYRNERFM